MFADKDNPIRCSKLASIGKCSMRVYMLEVLGSEDTEGGPTAQTGSVLHAAVAEFHVQEGGLKVREKAAWDAANQAFKKFPLADETEVRLYLTPYMADMRNITAKFYEAVLPERMPDGSMKTYHRKAIEVPVDFTLPPHPFDKSKKKIYVQGTLDQIRIEHGSTLVDDLKSGKTSGFQMIHDYAIQIAAYTFGARQIGITGAIPGRIIRAMGYRTREDKGSSPDGVFWHMPYLWKDVEVLLEDVRLQVALVRNGDVQFRMGPHCSYCEFGGLAGCLTKWRELIKLGKM